jgi:hypothetical protein
MPTFGIDGDQGPRGAGWGSPPSPQVLVHHAAGSGALVRADPTMRALRHFVRAVREEQRRPGVIGQHLHMIVAWSLATTVVWHGLNLPMVGWFAIWVELLAQHFHAKVHHPGDWRARESVRLMACAQLIGAVFLSFAYFQPEKTVWMWQLLATAVYCAGQWVAGEAWHYHVHKARRRRGANLKHWRRTLFKVAIGLLIMLWGTRIAF